MDEQWFRSLDSDLSGPFAEFVCFGQLPTAQTQSTLPHTLGVQLSSSTLEPVHTLPCLSRTDEIQTTSTRVVASEGDGAHASPDSSLASFILIVDRDGNRPTKSSSGNAQEQMSCMPSLGLGRARLKLGCSGRHRLEVGPDSLDLSFRVRST